MPGTAIVQNSILEALDGDLCLTTTELAGVTACEQKSIPKATCKLVSTGLVERVEIGCFRLTAEGLKAKKDGLSIKSGPKGKLTATKPRNPKKTTTRTKIWRAMRKLGKFSSKDIERYTAEESPVVLGNIQRYLNTLQKAGYIQLLPKRAKGSSLTSNGFKRYRLIRDTGHLAPIWQQKDKCVFDQNTEEVFPCVG